jgi:uncharacterized protein (DUF924 family)
MLRLMSYEEGARAIRRARGRYENIILFPEGHKHAETGDFGAHPNSHADLHLLFDQIPRCARESGRGAPQVFATPPTFVLLTFPC